MDTSRPAGTWYLVANAWRVRLSIEELYKSFSGEIQNEGGTPEAVDQIVWEPLHRWLEFRRNGAGFFQWYRVCITYGVMAGRFSHATISTKPALNAYTGHVTGWSPDWLDSGPIPRTWNITIRDWIDAVLRVDRNPDGVLCGRLKVYNDRATPGVNEELEYDLTSVSWDGTNISFVRNGPGFIQVYTGKAVGRFISGTFTHNGGAPFLWSGARSEVLGFGLGSRLPQRSTWQAETRARVVNLTEGMRLANVGIPPITVENEGPVALFTGGTYPAERDDDPSAWPPSYTLQRLRFTVSPGSRFDPAKPPPARVFHGYLATPTGPAPPGGFRAVVAVNGHDGNAQATMTSSHGLYWYGDSAARRNLIVLAIDIGHRPRWGAGWITHPDIVDDGYTDSNWEEDGERAFSVRRAIDWLMAQPNVRTDRIFMFGLSMGGEVTTIVSGLDTRIAMAVSAGFSPDMHVMDLNDNHPCYRWDHADIHEYLDVSDWQALIAPRPLAVQTGKDDSIFSPRHPPFSADKQVTRRARAAYGPDADKLIHYLHYGGHEFHVGAKNPTNPGRPQNILAVSVTDATVPGDLTWQTDSGTTIRSRSLYDLMNELLP